jgi:uncharacterized membrane protein
MHKKGRWIMKMLTGYFFKGVIILAPITASIYIVYIMFTKVDGWLKLPIPGVGLLITVSAVTLIGFLASNFVTKKLFSYVERLLSKLPLVKILYSSIKDLIGAFIGDKKSFDRPVLVNLGENTCVVGFLTKDDLAFLGLAEYVSVYLPQSYNFAGNLLVVPSNSVKPISANSSDVMAFIVSGGVSGSKQG